MGKKEGGKGKEERRRQGDVHCADLPSFITYLTFQFLSSLLPNTLQEAHATKGTCTFTYIIPRHVPQPYTLILIKAHFPSEAAIVGRRWCLW